MVFVLTRVLPRASELAYGIRHGWLGAWDVQAVITARREAGAADPEASSGRVWTYLALAWLMSHRDEYEDPWDAIERLYADFDYPEEMADIVRWTPERRHTKVGLPAMEERWRRLVDHLSAEYRARPAR